MNKLFLLSGLGMVVVALVPILYWKKNTAFKYFAWGALAWIVAVALKFAWAVPLNEPIINFLENQLPVGLAGPLAWIYVGLLTGIFECGIVLGFIYIISSLRKANWEDTVGYGIGFGAVEAFLLGIGSLVSVSLVVFFPESLPQDVLEAIQPPESLWHIPIPIIERVSAIIIHLFSTILIVYAFFTKMWKWFWLSFLYKTVVDTIAAYIHLAYGVDELTMAGWWILELVFVILALVGLWGLLKIHRRWKQHFDRLSINGGEVI